MIRIVLVEDQTLVRRGIAGLLATVSDLELVGEAEDGVEAVEVIRRVRPDVVLLDVRLPRQSGVDVLKELAASGGAPPTILLTTFDDPEALLQAAKAGAMGFLLKDVSVERLATAIRTVAQGRSMLQPAITERAVRVVQQRGTTFEASEFPERLTLREAEVLRMIAGGLSNREIAEALGAAEGSIKNHTSSILAKMGVRDRTQAVLKGIELGYIP